METRKAYPRRLRERFFDRYLVGDGVDIGCGTDPVTPTCVRWDRDRDAYKLTGEYDWIYSSHCLEHLERPVQAVEAWWSCLRPGGRLIVVVPHRDLYERKKAPPSRWNSEHATFWLPDGSGGGYPTTRGLLETILNACPDAELLRLTVEDTGWLPLSPDVHAVGEYSIEGVWRKPVAP